MIRIATLFAALMLFSMGGVQAQQQHQLTLDEAIEIALENNTWLKQAENAIEQSEVSLRGDRANYLPNLNLSTSGNRTVGRQFDQVAGEVDDVGSTGTSASLNANYDIFTGFDRINSIRSSRTALDATRDDYERTKETLIFNTASTYLDVLLEKELVEVNRENLETSRRQLEQVEAQVEVGTAPSVDLYEQRSTVANAELDLIRRENSLEMAKTQLIGYLQIDPFVDYELVEPEIIEEELIPQDYDLRQLIEEAMDSRRDLMAARKDIEQSNYDLNSARSGRYPTVSLNASLSSNYSDRVRMPGAQGETIPFSDQFFDQNIQRRVGLSISIPIFNRFQTSNQIEQAKIQRRNAQLELEDLQYEVIQEVRQAYNDYQGYAKELEASQAAKEAAELAFQTQQERYEVGSATLLELTEAQSSFVEAQSNWINAQYQFIFQEKILDYYLGRISEEPELSAMDD